MPAGRAPAIPACAGNADAWRTVGTSLVGRSGTRRPRFGPSIGCSGCLCRGRGRPGATDCCHLANPKLQKLIDGNLAGAGRNKIEQHQCVHHFRMVSQSSTRSAESIGL